MSRWQLDFPYRSRDEPLDLGVAHDLAVEAGLGEEQAGIVTALAIDLVGECATFGDVVDRIAAMSPAQRRELLDKARVRAGLPTTGEQDAHDEFERANRPRPAGPLRDGSGRTEARCGEPTCQRVLPHPELPGAVAWVDQRRWWCPEHEHLAEPGDLEPYTPRITVSMSGAIRFPDEDEAERQRAEVQAESRRRRREAQQAERRADYEKLRELERARDEQWAREHIRIPGQTL